MYALLVLAGLALAAPLSPPSEWQTVYAVMMHDAVDGPELSADARRMLDGLHMQHQLRLQAGGAAAAGGLFTDDAGGASAMMLLCADSAAAAKELASADPLVQFGQVTLEIRPWRVPAGALSCGTDK